MNQSDLGALARVEIRKGSEKNKHNLVLVNVDSRPIIVGTDILFHEARSKAAKLASQYSCAILNMG